MEYLRGLSLTGVLAARNQMRFERTHALAIIRDVGGAIAHAHSRTVVHGDLNPGNIFITNEGDIRVLDFGAAHAAPEGPTVFASADHVPVATPRYASPQVLDGQRPDARDDVYSLACLSYALLSGKHPFGEKTALGAQEQRLRPSRPDGLSWKEWRALRAGLVFDRERRPSDVTQWLNAFDWSKAAARLPLLITLVRVPARKHYPWWLPALGTAVVAAALAAALWASGYLDAGRRTPSRAASESETQSDVPPPRSNGSSTSVQAPSSGAAGEPAHTSPEQPAARAATPAPSQAAAHTASAPVAPAAASPSPTSSPPSSSANARTSPAASSRGAPVETGTLPRSRVELAADAVDVPLTDPAARIVVRRRGSLQGDATFTWWTESGTAKPGQDFMAVSPHPEVIEDGKSSVSLFIPIVGDPTRKQPKSFYVVINDPGQGVTLGARTLTMVTIPPSQ